MAIKKEVLDELLAEAGGKDVFGKDGLFNDLKKALAERILNAEMDHHLASEAEDAELKRGNHRNGYSKKRVLTDTAHLDIDIPRDRAGSFEPELIAKYQRRFPGFDEKVVSMYARGLTVREIQGHLQELYGVCQESCVWCRVDHYASENLSSKIMAKWVFAGVHSRGGIIQFFAV